MNFIIDICNIKRRQKRRFLFQTFGYVNLLVKFPSITIFYALTRSIKAIRSTVTPRNVEESASASFLARHFTVLRQRSATQRSATRRNVSGGVVRVRPWPLFLRLLEHESTP